MENRNNETLYTIRSSLWSVTSDLTKTWRFVASNLGFYDGRRKTLLLLLWWNHAFKMEGGNDHSIEFWKVKRALFLALSFRMNAFLHWPRLKASANHFQISSLLKTNWSWKTQRRRNRRTSVSYWKRYQYSWR